LTNILGVWYNRRLWQQTCTKLHLIAESHKKDLTSSLFHCIIGAGYFLSKYVAFAQAQLGAEIKKTFSDCLKQTMTLITYSVTHFWVTFEKVLHFRTGAPAPKIIKKQMIMIIICINRKVKKTQMIMVIIWVVVFHVEQFSVNLNNDEKLNENHYHWADCPDNFHFHFKAD